jgi:sulfonate transport system substrate-binding protein
MKRLVLAAAILCAAAGVPAQTPAQGKAIRVAQAGHPSFTWFPFLAAQRYALGDLPKDVAGKVEVTYVPTGNQATVGLIAGEYDFAIMFVSNAIKARAEGQDLVVLASLVDSAMTSLVVRTDLPEIKSPRDIKGRVFGIVGLGSGHHMIGMAIAEANGIDPSDITWRSTGGAPGWIPAVRAKRVDVLLAGEPTITKLAQDGLARVLLDLHGAKENERVFGGPISTVAIVARRDYVASHPRVAQAFVDATLKTLKWLHGRPPKEIVRMLPDDLAKHPDAEAILSRLAPAVSPTGEVKPAAVTTVAKWMKRIDEIPKDFQVDPAKVIDARFFERSTVLRGGG